MGDSSHEFDALNTLLLVVVLGLCILSAYLIKDHKFYYLPESAASLLVGIIVGGLAKLFGASNKEVDVLRFEPEFFFFILLPPIIFEAGYSLRKKHFFENFFTIILYAVIGTVISTFIIGFMVFAFGKAGWVDIDTSNPIEALIFGSLISAVDPVATLSIIGNAELNCDPLLYSLVFGESVLNDAVAIVLFKTFDDFYEEGDSVFTTTTIFEAMGSFIGISLGSILCGIFFALLLSYICKHTKLQDYPKFEVAILILFAYGSYAFAEGVDLSGIMALFFCGIVLSHYNSYNLSLSSQVTSEHMFSALATLAEYFVFLYMGMGVFIGRYKDWSGGFIILAIITCLLARLFNIFPLSWVANKLLKRNTKKIPLKMQVVIWFAGLRGAIAFALSQNMPGQHKDVYSTTTLAIVIFTTLICGGLTEPLLDRTGMKKIKVGDDDHAYEVGSEHLIPDPENNSNKTKENKHKGKLHNWFSHFDKTYMKPLFGGSIDDNHIDLHNIMMRTLSENSFHVMREGIEDKIDEGESKNNNRISNEVDNDDL